MLPGLFLRLNPLEWKGTSTGCAAFPWTFLISLTWKASILHHRLFEQGRNFPILIACMFIEGARCLLC
jgi:hypothetical protein